MLDDNTLRRIAPSVFAEEPYMQMSEKYQFIPTINVVNALRKVGFHPVQARQSRSRIEGKGDYTRHMIRFRDGAESRLKKVGDSFPEIVLTNSHDGSSSYEIMAGLFRLACSNGMVVSEAGFGGFRTRHTGDIVAQVINNTEVIIDDFPKVVSKISAMKEKVLTYPQQASLASAAIGLRWDDQAPVDHNKVLCVRREIDKGNDLWRVFNRIQENLIRGGLAGTATTGRRITTRKVESVTEDIRINKGLWALALEMLK